MKDDNLYKDMVGWLQSQQIDATTDYVGRGRQFSLLDLPNLTARWVATFRDHDEYLGSRELRTLSSDYASEFGLRNIDPSTDLIRADFAKIQNAITKIMKGLSKEAHDDLAAEVAEDLDEFRWQRDQGKN
jgi:hypothetical protein